MKLDEYRSLAVQMLADADRLILVHGDPVKLAAVTLTDPTQCLPTNANDRAARVLWSCLCELYVASQRFQADSSHGPGELIAAASAIRALFGLR